MIRVSVRYTKKAQADPALMNKLRQPMVMGQAMAEQIRDRVQNRGATATKALRQYMSDVTKESRLSRANRSFSRYERALEHALQSGRTADAAKFQEKLRKIDDRIQNLGDKIRPFVISEDYARLIGVTKTRYRSSAAFHDEVGVRRNTFRVSGGMWEGLQVRNVGSDAVIIDFAGSSPGAFPSSARTATGRTRKKAPLVRNQAKAGTVFNKLGVNPIQPTDGEQEALAAAVCRWSQRMMTLALGATTGHFQTTADQQLLGRLLQLYDGSR